MSRLFFCIRLGLPRSVRLTPYLESTSSKCVILISQMCDVQFSIIRISRLPSRCPSIPRPASSRPNQHPPHHIQIYKTIVDAWQTKNIITDFKKDSNISQVKNIVICCDKCEKNVKINIDKHIDNLKEYLRNLGWIHEPHTNNDYCESCFISD